MRVGQCTRMCTVRVVIFIYDTYAYVCMNECTHCLLVGLYVMYVYMLRLHICESWCVHAINTGKTLALCHCIVSYPVQFVYLRRSAC